MANTPTLTTQFQQDTQAKRDREDLEDGAVLIGRRWIIDRWGGLTDLSQYRPVPREIRS